MESDDVSNPLNVYTHLEGNTKRTEDIDTIFLGHTYTLPSTQALSVLSKRKFLSRNVHFM